MYKGANAMKPSPSSELIVVQLVNKSVAFKEPMVRHSAGKRQTLVRIQSQKGLDTQTGGKPSLLSNPDVWIILIA